jgi:hypothetical protein
MEIIFSSQAIEIILTISLIYTGWMPKLLEI